MNGNAFMIMAGTKKCGKSGSEVRHVSDDRPGLENPWILQNSSVPQLKSLLTDPDLTGIPHFQAFLDIAAHPNDRLERRR